MPKARAPMPTGSNAEADALEPRPAARRRNAAISPMLILFILESIRQAKVHGKNVPIDFIQLSRRGCPVRKKQGPRAGFGLPILQADGDVEQPVSDHGVIGAESDRLPGRGRPVLQTFVM